ncbi:cupin domain-containing protein [Thermodesulfobacteriota bacterium]
MNDIKYLRIYSDSEGCSHFETLTISLASNNYAPPAMPLNTSTPESAQTVVFLDLPKGWFGDWHPTPVRQWLILMTGECEFETGDGKRCKRKAGDVVLLEDTTGPGHRTRVIGNVAMRIAAIHLS